MYSTQDRDLMEVEENFLEDYNRYEEEDWQVWVRKQQSTSAPSSLSSSLDNVDQYKVVHFFIKDLHASEQVDKNFILNGKSLLYVYLSGTIISQYDHRDKFCLIVNDGTASIICLLENNTSDKIEQEKLRLKKSTTDYYPQAGPRHCVYSAKLRHKGTFG
ncbi:hypothetical protein NQ318_007049 [Aromia moschata]|uniref:Uncharacterized protein n=1 Tax=Aromia moschata TaxID=1265417 RepID=A0AAV8XH41_9CUCU|nr:hypothetical protein NQ318_007049 [Aromia moschata]